MAIIVTDWREYSPFFRETEFTCRCGCGQTRMRERFMGQLYDLRREFARPMVITSGYRCQAHNQRVSTTGDNGPHTTGLAADVLVSGPNARLLVDLAVLRGFKGIGISQKGPHAGRFIHLDRVDRPEPLLWSY
jgi:zinc D-Ala-D-Ala carboxypeptidase